MCAIGKAVRLETGLESHLDFAKDAHPTTACPLPLIAAHIAMAAMPPGPSMQCPQNRLHAHDLTFTQVPLDLFRTEDPFCLMFFHSHHLRRNSYVLRHDKRGEGKAQQKHYESERGQRLAARIEPALIHQRRGMAEADQQHQSGPHEPAMPVKNAERKQRGEK